ncbi:MAG: 30S ribosomal protein S9 [Armatimonadetes bacterium]|nr:30S ribosomal protein S9 [Armatimonadota bacterium]
MQQMSYGTGRRKEAVARVWVRPGTGNVTINGQEPLAYLTRERLVEEIMQPLRAMAEVGTYDVKALVKGGGICGQAGAVRHGIAKALVDANPENRSILGPLGLLTRDPRMKERKHAGKRRARRAKQFSKR